MTRHQHQILSSEPIVSVCSL